MKGGYQDLVLFEVGFDAFELVDENGDKKVYSGIHELIVSNGNNSQDVIIPFAIDTQI